MTTRTVRALPAIAALLLASCGNAPTQVLPSASPLGPPARVAVPTPPRDAVRAHVVAVSDGDTIVLTGIGLGDIQSSTGGHRSRLIGIDTPEVFGSVGCYGPEASAFTKRELMGADVLVSFDVQTLDRYGRALVYVWQTDGRFFNARLALEGYAYQLTIPPDVRYAELFTQLVSEARRAGRGLWSGC